MRVDKMIQFSSFYLKNSIAKKFFAPISNHTVARLAWLDF